MKKMTKRQRRLVRIPWAKEMSCNHTEDNEFKGMWIVILDDNGFAYKIRLNKTMTEYICTETAKALTDWQLSETRSLKKDES